MTAKNHRPRSVRRSTASDAELARLNERLDDANAILSGIKEELTALRADVKINAVLCAECRPKVMGNGKESLDNRLARLEEARAVSKTFLLGVVSIAGVAGSLATAALRLLGVR